MTRSIVRFALVALVGLTVADNCRAHWVPHKEKTDGTINVSEPISETVAVQEWTAEGRATHMGKYTETGSHKVNLATGAIFDGEFTSVAADGSTVSGIYVGSFTLNPDGTVDYQVMPIWLEGTGRFEGLFGFGVVTAHATGVAPGSTFHFDARALWNLP